MMKTHHFALMLIAALCAACRSAEPAPQATAPAEETSRPPTATAVPTEATAPTVTPDLTDTPDSEPATAPQPEGLIAFYSERDGNAEIYTMRPDGTDQRRLTFNECDDYSPVWSPDGSQIAFVSDRDDPDPRQCFPDCHYQIYVINADGSGERRLVETELRTHHPDWHPDGTKLSFDTEFNLEGNIYVVSTDGSGLRLLIEDGFWADWSPEGTQIAFASNRDGNVEIYVADADGGNQRRLTDNTRLDFFPAWSPDGRRIAFATREQKQIYAINADGSQEQQLTDQGLSEDPDWSPDGSTIVFQSSRDGNFEIYTLRVADALQGGGGSACQRLTNHAAGDFWPSWGPAPLLRADAAPVVFEKGAQTFASVPTWQIGLADLDADGHVDAVFGNARQQASQVWLNDGGAQGGTSGHFSDSGQRLTAQAHGIDVGDLDGDRDLDLLITSYTTQPTEVYLNDGTARFEEVDGAFDGSVGYGVFLADIDGDGDLDIFLATFGQSEGPNEIWFNQQP